MKTRFLNAAMLFFVFAVTTALFSCGGADMDENPEPYYDPSNGHEFVDLGLSVKWATCNVGADNPWDYGNYFAWGETAPKSDYSWATYKWCNGSSHTLTKYNTNEIFGIVDNKLTLEPADDAAVVNWGGKWRMPTYNDYAKLRANCYWEWTTNYNGRGVSGYIVYKAKADADKGVIKNTENNATTSATYSLSDNHIFLPAAGSIIGTDSYDVGSQGFYWLAMTSEDNWDDATCINYRSGYVDHVDGYRRSGGSVRPVLQK